MTSAQIVTKNRVLREDVLISVCFGNLSPDAADFDAVRALAQQLDAHFRFREIVIIAEESHKEAFLPLVQSVENLRLLTVRDDTAFYRRRVIAAAEAIGDIVLMANAAELAYVDAVGMITRAGDDQRAILASREVDVVNNIIGSPLSALGRVAGFRVNLRDLQSLALPRTLLNLLLSHADPELALRFPPRDVRVPLKLFAAHSDTPTLRDARQKYRRIALMQKLLVYIAPSLLMFVTVFSALLALLGFIYAFYILGAWIVVDDPAPGWLTLSAMLSLTSFFLGVSIMGLSLGLQQLLARANGHEVDGEIKEINRIDLFGQVAADLNVDLERDVADHSGPISK